jgi:hypothetical protein
MKKYVTASGRVLTDADFDEMAKEYEDGTWEGTLGKVVYGRPRISDEDARSVSFKLPLSRIAAIDRVAAKAGKTRSEFLRDAVDQALIAELVS